MPEVVAGVLAGGIGGLVLSTALAFALIVSLFNDQVNRRFRKLLRAVRSGK